VTVSIREYIDVKEGGPSRMCDYVAIFFRYTLKVKIFLSSCMITFSIFVFNLKNDHFILFL